MITNHNLDCFYTICKPPQHDLSVVSELIKGTEDYFSLVQKSEYIDDKIGRVDWEYSKDFERPWTIEFMKFLSPNLKMICDRNGFEGFRINELWFQEYSKGGVHGWHTHSSNFTGVYYLQLDEDAPKTKLVDPWTLKMIVEPEVQQGDILIFPSYVIHKAPKMKDTETKTIISFNVDFHTIKPSTIQQIDSVDNAK